jgi:hypothetical protein
VDFLGGLIDFLSAVGAELAQIVVALVNVIIQVFQFVWGVLGNVFNFLYKIAGNVLKLFHHLWDFFFKQLWPKIVGLMRKVHDFLESKLGPIIKFLKKYRDLIDRNYRLYIKPILKFLQRVRQVLAVMRFLHISFAKALDQKIAQIENTLSKNFLQLRGLLTSMINALNAVVDLPLLFRKPVLVLSIRRVFNSLVRVLTGFPVGYFLPSPRKSAKKGIAAPPPKANFNDPDINPPASSYISGNDGLGGFDGFVPGETPDDSVVDSLEALDYFSEELYPSPTCVDPIACMEEALLRTEAIVA